MKLIISSLFEMGQYHGQVTHVISILDSDDKDRPLSLGVPDERRLVILCDDVESAAEAREPRRTPEGRCVAPTKAMVAMVLRFARELPEAATLLVHCSYGISRSPALALALLCQGNPNLPETYAYRQLRALRPHVRPNTLIVELADELLGREGRMSRAIQSSLNP